MEQCNCIYIFVEDPLPWVKKFDKEGQLLLKRRVHASLGNLSIDSEGSIYVLHRRYEVVKLDDELNQIFRMDAEIARCGAYLHPPNERFRYELARN